MDNNPQDSWKAYCEEEISALTPILKTLGFSIDENQPHLKGERFLMQAVTTQSGRKLILLGTQDSDNTRVVIKATRDKNGGRELDHEHKCRELLHSIRFAYSAFISPREILFEHRNGFVLSIQEFIEQESAFLERPVEEQFDFALRAFKAQEGTRATTSSHIRSIKKVYATFDSIDYRRTFLEFQKNIEKTLPQETSIHHLLNAAARELKEKSTTIERYGGFLTHVDFVPHNFRIKDGEIYLLDHSSLRFGNKYEGWARFVNFMTLHNPDLGQALLMYIKENRVPEELESLRLMRLYRLGEIIWYYTQATEKSAGDLLALNTRRVHFWANVLAAVLDNKQVPDDVLSEYKRSRDQLRSPEERARQIGLH